MFRATSAEAIGSFVLVLTIVSVVVAASLAEPVAGAPYGSLTVAVAGGLALAVSVASLGHVSGAHLNPAVTLGAGVESPLSLGLTPPSTCRRNWAVPSRQPSSPGPLRRPRQDRRQVGSDLSGNRSRYRGARSQPKAS